MKKKKLKLYSLDSKIKEREDYVMGIEKGRRKKENAFRILL